MTDPTPTVPPAPRGPLVPPPVQALLAVIGTLAVSVVLVVLAFTNWQQQQQIAALADSLQAANDQVIELGADPVAPPPEAITGEPGQPGVAGAAGADGVSVLSVSCSSGGSFQVVYSNGRVQRDIGDCVAEDGKDGVPGSAGAPGSNGLEGPSGQPPVSWTVDGVLNDYECTRTVPFDPDAPTYTCTIINP